MTKRVKTAGVRLLARESDQDHNRSVVTFAGEPECVVEGALRTLKEQVDVVVLELTLVRVHGGTKTLLEMCNRMNALGFRIFDQVGNWRVPTSGELEQLDVVFVRKDLPGTFKSVPAESRRK